LQKQGDRRVNVARGAEELYAAQTDCARMEQTVSALRSELKAEETRASQLLRDLRLRQQLTQQTLFAPALSALSALSAPTRSNGAVPLSTGTQPDSRPQAVFTSGRLKVLSEAERLHSEAERRRVENGRLRGEVNALVEHVVELQKQVILTFLINTKIAVQFVHSQNQLYNGQSISFYPSPFSLIYLYNLS